MTWPNLSTQSTPNWLAVGLVLALHTVLIWGMSQAQQQPPQRLDFGAPLMVRFIQAPPAPKPVAPPPTPEIKPVPKVKPEPKPEPRVERPPEPVKLPEPVEEPLIAQTRPEPVPMETAPPVPKPPPRLEPQPKPAPPVVLAPERAPLPPRSAPVADTVKEAPVTPPNIMAAYQDNPPPVYPMRSRRLGEQGQVLLRVHLTSGGHVDQIKVQRSCGHRRLDQAALEAVRDWRFAPARRGERPIAAWVLIPIQFELS